MSDCCITKPKKYQKNIQVLLSLHPFLPVCTHGNFNYKTVYSFSNIQDNSIHFSLILGVYVSNNLKQLCITFFFFSQIDSINVIYKENME